MPSSQDIINSQLLEFNKQMTLVIRNLSRFMNRKIKLTMDRGFIVPIEANFKNITMVAGELIEQLEKAGYYDLIKEFTRNNKDFTAVQIKEMGKRFAGSAAYYGALEKTVFKGLQNMQYNGMTMLGESRVNAISQALYNSVISGMQNNQLVVTLQKELDIMGKYTETYIRTAKREYSQQTEFEVAREAGITDIIWEYIGAPLQDNSHPECVWALVEKPHAPYFTTAEMEEFQAGGGLDHTEPRWNCQHIFGITDMTMEEYLEA